MIDTLITNTTVITVDRDRRVLTDGAVAIKDGWIEAVGPTDEITSQFEAGDVLDGRHKVVIPGMVDLYAHGGCGMLKSVGEQYLGIGWWKVMDELLHGYTTPRWWYIDSQLHAAERLRFGCTAMLTQPGLSHARLDSLEPITQVASGLEDLGVRAGVIAGLPRAMPWNDRYANLDGDSRVEKSVDPDTVMGNVEDLFDESKGVVSDKVKYWLGTFVIGAPKLASPDRLESPFAADRPIEYFRSQAERLLALKSEYDTRYWAHAWADAITHAQQDGFADFLGSDTVLSHCTRLDQASIDILASTGTHVNHCPRARRLQMWHESCLVVEMMEAGVNVGLGSDGPHVDRNCDPFMDMQMAFKLQRRRLSDVGALPVGTLLEMSTLNGYRAMGIEDIGGSIEVGKQADLVVVDMHKPHLWPISMPVHQLVYYANGNDVEHVFVGGQQLVQDGRLTTIDENALLDEAAEELERMLHVGGPTIQRLFRDDNDIWSTARRQLTDPVLSRR